MGRLTHRTAPGWTYVVTTKAAQNISVFQVQEIAEIVVGKMIDYRNKGKYLLHEFALMPNHLHLILTPSNLVSLEKAMQLIKGGSSYEIHRIRGNKMQIWQSGFHESRILNSTDYKKRADYIRFNPVTAKLVEVPGIWPYGSASGKYQLDPIPQGLKPVGSPAVDVGAKAPTPKDLATAAPPAEPELKLRPPEKASQTAVPQKPIATPEGPRP